MARRVILVDLQGHGRTADVDRPLRPEPMADDIAALIEHLGLERADLPGYSTGADVALRTAIQRPRAVRRLVVVPTPCRRGGRYAEVVAAMDQMGVHAAEPMKQSPVYELYARLAPRPQDWSVLVGRTAGLKQRDYDRSAEIPAITAPTLLVFGDADAVPPTHIAEFYALLGSGLQDAGFDGAGRSTARPAILPGAGPTRPTRSSPVRTPTSSTRALGLVSNAPSTGRLHVEATRECRGSVVAKGADPGACNDIESAADYDALRRALGIRKWNVFGISYGTHLALNYMRLHPNGIRSVGIDGVLPSSLRRRGRDLEGRTRGLRRPVQGPRAAARLQHPLPEPEGHIPPPRQ